MINRSLKRLMQLGFNNNLSLFSTHHEAIPTKLSKVSEIVYTSLDLALISTSKTDTVLLKKCRLLLENLFSKPSVAWRSTLLTTASAMVMITPIVRISDLTITIPRDHSVLDAGSCFTITGSKECRSRLMATMKTNKSCSTLLLQISRATPDSHAACLSKLGWRDWPAKSTWIL